MSLELADQRSRRALLRGMLGGLGAAMAAGLARPQAVLAGTDGDVVLGGANPLVTSTTGITAETDDAAVSVSNISLGSVGLRARGGAIGVDAHADEGGWAVHAQGGTDESGIPGGALLADGFVTVEGHLTLSRSGRATVLSGRSSVDIDLRTKGGLNGALCFANVMSYRPGSWVTMVRPNYPITGKARIYLNKAASADTYVAWLALN